MELLFMNAKKYLPLLISFLEVDDYYLSFGSDDWNFYTDSNWRVIKEKRIICSDESIDQSILQKLLLNTHILSIEALNNEDNLDPVFVLSNLYQLQIFSKSNDEPWKLTLPDITYVPYG